MAFAVRVQISEALVKFTLQHVGEGNGPTVRGNAILPVQLPHADQPEIYFTRQIAG